MHMLCRVDGGREAVTGVDFGISKYALLKTMAELIENGIYKHRPNWDQKTNKSVRLPVSGRSSSKGIMRFNDASRVVRSQSFRKLSTRDSKQIMTVTTL